MIITLENLNSSNIFRIEYTSSGTLLITFQSGSMYRYFDVPLKTFYDFLEAESKGKYFNANIRNNFKYEKLDGVKNGG